MKKKIFLAFAMMTLASAASAQVQLLFLEGGRNVIDRNKKLYWMDGDDDPCYDILNYKKTGNKETFTLRGKEDLGNGQRDTYTAVMMLDAKTQLPVELTLTQGGNKQTSKVTTTSGSKNEDERLLKYFNELAGNPVAPASAAGGVSAPAKVADVKPEEDPKGATDKVKDTAKDTFGKVKGLFKKKK